MPLHSAKPQASKPEQQRAALQYRVESGSSYPTPPDGKNKMSMSWIENANWETTPARPAPEGQTSNLIDPPSLGYRVTASNSVCGVFVVLIVALRFYTRMHIVRGLGGDDCEVFSFSFRLCLLPLVCAFFAALESFFPSLVSLLFSAIDF